MTYFPPKCYSHFTVMYAVGMFISGRKYCCIINNAEIIHSFLTSDLHDSDMGSLGKKQSRRALSLNRGSCFIRCANVPYLYLLQLFYM